MQYFWSFLTGTQTSRRHVLADQGAVGVALARHRAQAEALARVEAVPHQAVEGTGTASACQGRQTDVGTRRSRKLSPAGVVGRAVQVGVAGRYADVRYRGVRRLLRQATLTVRAQPGLAAAHQTLEIGGDVGRLREPGLHNRAAARRQQRINTVGIGRADPDGETHPLVSREVRSQASEVRAAPVWIIGRLLRGTTGRQLRAGQADKLGAAAIGFFRRAGLDAEIAPGAQLLAAEADERRAVFGRPTLRPVIAGLTEERLSVERPFVRFAAEDRDCRDNPEATGPHGPQYMQHATAAVTPERTPYQSCPRCGTRSFPRKSSGGSSLTARTPT